MKKALALLLAALISSMAFAGCGRGGEAPSSSAGSPAASSAAPANGNSEEKELNIFTWDGYFPQDVQDAFTEQTGIKLNFSNFETNEEMLTKLQASNAGDYDIVVVSDYMVAIMNELGGLLKEIDKEKVPNYQNLDPAYLGKFYDPDNLYTVPYGPGAPLIVYDPATCPVEIKGYADLWNPALKDSLVLMDSSRVIIGITLKTMGRSFNETDTAVLAEAKEKLMGLKDNVRTLSVNNLQDVILSGEASAGFMFTSQVAMALDANPELQVVYPEEGLGFGIDCLTVAANAPHPDNAFAFLNFLLEPQTAANVSSQIYYLCPNTAAQEFLPEAYKANGAFATPSEMLDKAEFVEDVGTELAAEYEKIWTEFKQQ